METKKTCPSSKTRYEDDDSAKYAARDSMLFRNSPELATYWCILCGGFHLTSTVTETKIKKNSKRKK